MADPNASDFVTSSQKPGATTDNSHMTVYVAQTRRWEYSSSALDEAALRISKSRYKEGVFPDQPAFWFDCNVWQAKMELVSTGYLIPSSRGTLRRHTKKMIH